MSIFSVLSMMFGVLLYERFLVPFARRFTKNLSGISSLQRMGVGFAINIISTLVSAPIEMRRKSIAAKHNLIDDPVATIPMSVFWLVPQFSLHGIAEVFMAVGHVEFLYDQSPESMRSSASALYCLTIAIGNYVGTMLVSLIHKYSGKETNWLPDRNLNKGRLEYYYLLVSGIQVINLLYFVVIAWLYTHKPLEETAVLMSKEEDLEEANDKIKISSDKLNVKDEVVL